MSEGKPLVVGAGTWTSNSEGTVWVLSSHSGLWVACVHKDPDVGGWHTRGYPTVRNRAAGESEDIGSPCSRLPEAMAGAIDWVQRKEKKEEDVNIELKAVLFDELINSIPRQAGKRVPSLLELQHLQEQKIAELEAELQEVHDALDLAGLELADDGQAICEIDGDEVGLLLRRLRRKVLDLTASVMAGEDWPAAMIRQNTGLADKWLDAAKEAHHVSYVAADVSPEEGIVERLRRQVEGEPDAVGWKHLGLVAQVEWLSRDVDYLQKVAEKVVIRDGLEELEEYNRKLRARKTRDPEPEPEVEVEVEVEDEDPEFVWATDIGGQPPHYYKHYASADILGGVTHSGAAWVYDLHGKTTKMDTWGDDIAAARKQVEEAACYNCVGDVRRIGARG